MASLKFYDGAKPGKNRKLLLNERFEKKKEYETLRHEDFLKNGKEIGNG